MGRARPSRTSTRPQNQSSGPNTAVGPLAPGTPARSAGSQPPLTRIRAASASTSRCGEGGPGGQGQRDGHEVLGEGIQGVREVEPERADPGPPQSGQVPADAEAGAEVAGQRPDVGAGGAVHLDVEINHYG